jgi:hypothetical protein
MGLGVSVRESSLVVGAGLLQVSVENTEYAEFEYNGP